MAAAIPSASGGTSCRIDRVLLDRPVKWIPHCIPPELFRQFRNLRKVDLAVGPMRKLLQLAFLIGPQANVSESLSHDFLHSGGAPPSVFEGGVFDFSFIAWTSSAYVSRKIAPHLPRRFRYVLFRNLDVILFQ